MTRRRFLFVLLFVMVLVTASLMALLLMIRDASQASAVNAPGWKHVRSIYGWGKEPEQLMNFPFSLVYRNGSLYVTEKDRARVVALTPEGELEGFYGEKGTGPGKISSPTGLEVDAEGNVYVADGRQQKLLVYDGEGKFLREVQVSDAPLTPLIDGNRMFLTTTGAVKVLTLPDLAEVTSWGSRGRGEAEYDYPNGLSYDTQSETLFVADGNNLRVKALDPNGNMRWIFGAPPRNMVERERAFGLPSGAVHANGYIFVPDALDGVVHILDDKGTEVAQVGNMGPAEGQLEYPSAIAHMGDNRFAIAEWGNQRIQIVDIDVAAASESWKAQAGE